MENGKSNAKAMKPPHNVRQIVADIRIGARLSLQCLPLISHSAH